MYDLDQCIKDCVNTYIIKDKGPLAKEDIYRTSFKALNEWIELKLAKQLVSTFYEKFIMIVFLLLLMYLSSSLLLDFYFRVLASQVLDALAGKLSKKVAKQVADQFL